jgi:hypothetical protein
MKGSVLRKVKNDKMKELYDGYVAKLKTGATIQIDETKLAAVEIKNSRRPFTPGAGLPGAAEGEEGAEEGGLEAGGGEDEGAAAPGGAMPAPAPAGGPAQK